MGCAKVTITRIGGDAKVTFREICGTDIGKPALFAQGVRLYDSLGRALFAAKQ